MGLCLRKCVSNAEFSGCAEPAGAAAAVGNAAGTASPLQCGAAGQLQVSSLLAFSPIDTFQNLFMAFKMVDCLAALTPAPLLYKCVDQVSMVDMQIL